MNKAELLIWLREEHRKWEDFLDRIDLAYMDQSGVVGHWSMKDLVAHLTSWNSRFVVRLVAAINNEPEPPPPWPEHLQDQDEINAWLYEASRGLSLHEIRKESDRVFQQLFTLVKDLPADIRIETVQTSPEREYYLVWLGNERYLVGEFFDHYRDDHASDVQAWLEKLKN